MKLFAGLLLGIFAVSWINPASGDESLLINLKQGKLQGSYLKSTSGRKFASFRGIPYAKPPVGKLRFKDPVPANGWEGVLDATREGPTCIQFDMLFKNVKGTEDCLALNVYTHEVKTDKPKPVMVWIHGGAFFMGSGNGETDFYGPNQFMNRDVVLVTINYRLGPFGFLSTEDAEAPGNYGLLDQSLALKWVRENIQFFGGDPKSVTIFGESAGGASVEFQVLSSRSTGLFDRAIAQSGSSQCGWSLMDTVGHYTKSLAETLNCPTTSSRELIDCLQTKTAQEITGIRSKITVTGMYPLAYGPRIDAERKSPFLPAHPQQLIEQKRFNQVPIITGMTQNEGSFMLAAMMAANGKEMKEFQNDPVLFMRYILGIEHHENGEAIAKGIIDDVFENGKPFDQQLDAFEKMLSDYVMFSCIDKSALLFKKYNEKPTYYYHYAHRGQYSYTKVIGAPSNIDFGVSHADELFMMFSTKMLPPLSTQDDMKVSNILLDLWVSFASQGEPQSDLVPRWLPNTDEQQNYLNINATPQLKSDPPPFRYRLPYWEKRISQFSRKHKDEL